MRFTFIPWLLALATAVWFGLMARRARRSWFLWAVAGGLFALVVSTIILGLGHAASIPFSDRDRTRLHIKWTAEAIVAIVALGWLFTMSLHRQHLALWQRARKIFPAAAERQSTNRPTEAKAKVQKQPPKRA